MRQKIHSPHEAIKGFQNEHFFRVVLIETFETKSSCRGISQLHSWKKGNLQFFSSAFAMASKKKLQLEPPFMIHSTFLQHIADSSNKPSKYSKPILHGTGCFFQHLKYMKLSNFFNCCDPTSSIFSPDSPVAKSPPRHSASRFERFSSL